MPAADDAERTALYRLYDAADVLLYVGIAQRPESRWLQHAADKEWWSRVRTYVVEWLPTREAAWEAEGVAMRDERPLFNVSRSPWRAAVTPSGDLEAAPKPEMRPRQVRIPDDLWDEFELATASLGMTRAAAIRAFISWYRNCPGAQPPQRPAVWPPSA